MKDLAVFSTLDIAEQNKIGELACKRFYRKNDFLFREGDPADTIYLIQLLGEKLNNYTNQVASIAFHDVKGRIAAVLLKLAGEYGSHSPEGTTIEIELTHSDLASLVNASRVMVSNVVGSLRQDGIIATKDHRFILLDQQALSSAVENPV